jgi:hypothetical protein
MEILLAILGLLFLHVTLRPDDNRTCNAKKKYLSQKHKYEKKSPVKTIDISLSQMGQDDKNVTYHLQEM